MPSFSSRLKPFPSSLFPDEKQFHDRVYTAPPPGLLHHATPQGWTSLSNMIFCLRKGDLGLLFDRALASCRLHGKILRLLAHSGRPQTTPFTSLPQLALFTEQHLRLTWPKGLFVRAGGLSSHAERTSTHTHTCLKRHAFRHVRLTTPLNDELFSL